MLKTQQKRERRCDCCPEKITKGKRCQECAVAIAAYRQRAERILRKPGRSGPRVYTCHATRDA